MSYLDLVLPTNSRVGSNAAQSLQDAYEKYNCDNWYQVKLACEVEKLQTCFRSTK